MLAATACGGGAGSSNVRCPEIRREERLDAHRHVYGGDDDERAVTVSRWRGRARLVEVTATGSLVRATRARGDDVEIVARGPVPIEVHGDSVTVRAEGTVELLIPHGVALRVTTVNGPVKMIDLDGDIDARTVNGPIKARVAGDDPNTQVSLRSVSGPVALDFADGASAHVHA